MQNDQIQTTFEAADEEGRERAESYNILDRTESFDLDRTRTDSFGLERTRTESFGLSDRTDSLGGVMREGGGHQRRLTQVAKVAEIINDLKLQKSENEMETETEINQMIHTKRLVLEFCKVLVEDRRVVLERLSVKYPDRGFDESLNLCFADLQDLEYEENSLKNVTSMAQEELSDQLSQLYTHLSDLDKLHEEERDLYEEMIINLQNELSQAQFRIAKEIKNNEKESFGFIQDQSKQLEEQIVEMTEQKQNLIIKIESLEKEMNEREEEIKNKEQEIEIAQTRFESTQEALEEADKLVEEHLTTIEKLEDDISWYEEEYEGEKRDNLLVEEAQNQIELMQSKLVENQERILQLEEELEQHRNKHIEKISLLTPTEQPTSTSIQLSENLFSDENENTLNLVQFIDNSESESEIKDLEEEEEDNYQKPPQEDTREIQKLEEELEEINIEKENLKNENERLEILVREIKTSKINVVKALASEMERMRSEFEKFVKSVPSNRSHSTS